MVQSRRYQQFGLWRNLKEIYGKKSCFTCFKIEIDTNTTTRGREEITWQIYGKQFQLLNHNFILEIRDRNKNISAEAHLNSFSVSRLWKWMCPELECSWETHSILPSQEWVQIPEEGVNRKGLELPRTKKSMWMNIKQNRQTKQTVQSNKNTQTGTTKTKSSSRHLAQMQEM